MPKKTKKRNSVYIEIVCQRRCLATEYAGVDKLPDYLWSDTKRRESEAKKSTFLDNGNYMLSNGQLLSVPQHWEEPCNIYIGYYTGSCLVRLDLFTSLTYFIQNTKTSLYIFTRYLTRCVINIYKSKSIHTHIHIHILPWVKQLPEKPC